VAIDAAPLMGDFRVCRYTRTPMGAQAYLIRLAAARRVLDIGLPIGLPADELLFRPRPARLRVYGIEPTPVVHEPFPSEVRAPLPPVRDHSRPDRLALEAVRLVGKARRRIERLGIRVPSRTVSNALR
jgi:hypothetical protein